MFSATRILRMSSNLSSSAVCAPFSRAVVNAMRKLYPEALADKSWDNTGLLLEAPFDPILRNMNSVLLTVDLTKAVADEAIERNDSIIVAYHPIIFRGLKSLTLANSQQQSLLRLAQKGISVYSPHTAIDAAPGGLGDWLADIVTGTVTTVDQEDVEDEADGAPEDADKSDPQKKQDTVDEDDPFVDSKRPIFMLNHHPSQRNFKDDALKLNSASHKREPIKPVAVEGIEGAGMGRIVTFNHPQPLSTLLERIAQGLGNPRGFPIAIPQGKQISDMKIKTVGICAGSGGSLFAGLDVDLLFTGELSHHEALAAIEEGKCVITLFHSNTERGFLHSVLRVQLQQAVKEEWEKLRKEFKLKDLKEVDGEVKESLKEALADEFVSVEVSEADRDPFGIVISKAAMESEGVKA